MGDKSKELSADLENMFRVSDCVRWNTRIYYKGLQFCQILLCLFIFSNVLPSTCAMQCDVHESGLDRAGREVGAAYVSCSTGVVVWRYPRNGLRVLMKSPLPGREFRVCIKAHDSFGGARVMVEGDSTLIPLLALGDKYPLQHPRCISSVNGKAALYLEADLLPSGFNNNVASFDYDVQTLPKGATYNPDQECVPCSSEELLETFCTADFIAIGHVTGVDYISFTHSLHPMDSVNHLTPSPIASRGGTRTISPHHPGEAYLKFNSKKVVREPSDSPAVFDPVRLRGSHAKISVPQHCGMASGGGEEFLIMGRIKLSSPTLKCIPTLHQFKELVRTRGPDASCSLEL